MASYALGRVGVLVWSGPDAGGLEIRVHGRVVIVWNGGNLHGPSSEVRVGSTVGALKLLELLELEEVVLVVEIMMVWDRSM